MTFSGLTCIVDDSADYRALIHLFFRRSCPQHTARTFAGGLAFLEALNQMGQLPNLVLLDRHMPGLDGHQTLTYLKQHPIYKRIPVVMMSAQSSQEEIEGCYESGVNSFLTKSLDPTFLGKSLSTVCQYWLELNQVAGQIEPA